MVLDRSLVVTLAIMGTLAHELITRYQDKEGSVMVILTIDRTLEPSLATIPIYMMKRQGPHMSHISITKKKLHKTNHWQVNRLARYHQICRLCDKKLKLVVERAPMSAGWRARLVPSEAHMLALAEKLVVVGTILLVVRKRLTNDRCRISLLYNNRCSPKG